MAVILQNSYLNSNTLKMTVKTEDNKNLGACGQFYMIKPNQSSDPFLGRPISIFDTDENNRTVTFVYALIGKGTELMSKMKEGDNITVTGPFGNPFPITDNDITIIGGGVGIAPLYLFAKQHKRLYPNKNIRVHLGFSNENAVILTEQYNALCDEVKINIGGYVTDDVCFTDNRIYYSCGPAPMMAAACKKAIANNKTLYVSLEKHMACGVGACLVCTCKTADGSKKRVCKDGPVFNAADVFDTEKGCFYE